jgi:Uncharacterized protein involved in cytokinesis, contains TGc (transglutaminase/protease-like) domain
MKNARRRKTARTLLMSALILAALSCAVAFLAVNAAEDTSSPEEASASDAAGQEGQAEDTEVVSYDRVVGASHKRFMPNAHYYGSFRSELLPDELPFYDAFVETMVTNRSNDPVTVDVSGMGYAREQNAEVSDMILSAYAAFSTDHPEVYWISGYGSTKYSLDGMFTSVVITPTERYSGAYSELATVTAGINSAVNTISNTRASSSNYDTAKAIHDYICDKMTYDYQSAGYGQAHCAAPLFGGGGRGYTFVCEGYANSFKLLCDRFGVPAVHVKGTAGGPHSWNYVQMDDGLWYGVDCTWDDNDSTPPLYTYFGVGSNTLVFNGKTFGQDHTPEDQVMTTNTVNPLVYPDLESEAYIPGDHFTFTGESASDNREVAGNAEFNWRFVGEMSAEGQVFVSVDGTRVTTLDMTQDGRFSYTLDTRNYANGQHIVTAVFHRIGADDLTDSRTIVVHNPVFGFRDWPDGTPDYAGTFTFYMLHEYGGPSNQCSVAVYLDGTLCQTLRCDNQGVFVCDIDTLPLTNGEHQLLAVFSNSSGTEISAQKTFRAANPSFGITLAKDHPAFTRNVTVTMKQEYCGSSAESPVAVCIDDVFYNTFYCDGNGLYSFVLDSSQLVNGEHVLTAVMSAASGIEISDYLWFSSFNTVPAQSVTLDKASVSLTAGQSAKLIATVIPANATDELIWTSDNDAAASVRENGVVVANAVGTATITVSVGGKTSSCTVTVTQAPESYPVKLNKSSVTLLITDNVKAPAVSLSASKPRSIKSVVWCSDDPDIAEVSNKGKVTGKKSGTANICCKSTDGEIISAPCVVYVNQFTIDTSALTSLESCSYIGGVYWVDFHSAATLNIIDNELPSAAGDDPIVWKSSNQGTVSVDASGHIVCAGKKGTVTITAAKGKTFRTSIKIRAFQPTTSLSLVNGKSSVYVGQSATAKAVLSKGSDEPVLWMSTHAASAPVSEKGVFKGIKQGTAKIVAYTKSGFSQEAPVTVRTRATGFVWDTVPAGLNPRSAVKYTLGVGGSKELYVRITAPVNSNDTITWSSSNQSVVAISSVLGGGNGVRVVGLKKGTASVTAKTGSGRKMTYQITVVPEGAQSIVLAKKQAALYVGGAVGLSAKILPKGCNDTVLWRSADPSIATVDENGRVTAVSQGDTVITAYSLMSGATDTASIHVMTKATVFTWDTVPEGLTPRSVVKYAIGQGDTKPLYVRIDAPADCNDTVSWTNSNKKAVEMIQYSATDKMVQIRGLANGTSKITAKTGSGKTVVYQITVLAKTGQYITLNKHDAVLYTGSTLSLSAKVDPRGTSVVMWRSSNPEIASVDENGKVTAKSNGSAVITAYFGYENKHIDQAMIRVITKATAVDVSASSVSLAVGESIAVSATVTPAGCGDSVTWTTSNKAVATAVSADGGNTVTITGVKAGSCTVKVKTGSGKYKNITVKVHN